MKGFDAPKKVSQQDLKSVLAESDDPHPEILAKAIKLGQVLGKGSFGTVYEATLLGKTVAVKVLDSESGIDIENKEFLTKFKHEISIMAKAHHPNIMLYMGACTSVPGKLMIVTEKLQIDLESLFVKDGPKKATDIPLERKLKYARDVAVALAFLHSRDPAFLHLDLKPANILLDDFGVIKVADFGQTLVKSQNRTSADEYQGGTPYYMAPEMLEGENINEKADVYSFSVSLWEILFQKKAFAYEQKLVRFIQDVVEKNVRPEIPDTVGTRKVIPRLKKLIEQSWDKNPKSRPLFPAILNEMNGILLEYALPDASAQSWWKSCFFDEFTQAVLEEVTWDKFVTSFEKTLKVTGPEKTQALEILKAVLPQEIHNEVKKGEKYVTLDYFGKVLGWFGPMDNLIPQLKKVLSYPYFYGDLANDAAFKKIGTHGNGAFMIRLSQSVIGGFTVSFLVGEGNKQEMKNKRFMYDTSTQKFHEKDKSYSTLDEFVNDNKDKIGISNGVATDMFKYLFSASNPVTITSQYTE